MGITKRHLEEVRSNWDGVAKSKSFKCKNCGDYIIYDEREVYFDSNMCGKCTHDYNKLMDED